MSTIEYNLKKIESKNKEAKIVEFNNKHFSKSCYLPAVMFDVQSREDLNAVKRYYFQGLPSDHIFGFTIPFSKLTTIVNELSANVPHDTTYLCDIETEIFWWGNIKETIQKYYHENPTIHEKIKKGIKDISLIHNHKDKINTHKEFWKSIIRNRRILLSLLTSYVKRQNAYQIGILSAFGPLLIDKDHIDFLEDCYMLTKRLYHNSTNDIEQQGKLIALYANFHTDFLAKAGNIPEFLKMIERTNPRALIFKIFNLKDIREKPTFKKNYDALVRGISDLSQSLNIPTFLLSVHTSGYKANMQGIDVFCEPFYREVNVPRERGGMNLETRNRLKEMNPTLMSGKIYNIKTGDLINRQEFQETCLTDTKIDSPIENLSKTNPSIVKGMTDSTFREFAKMLLMESRNFEETQLHKGIDDDDLSKIRLKVSRWEGNNIPK